MAFRRMVTAAMAATALLFVLASPARAECMTWPRRATERPVVAYAFSATVTGLSQRDDPDQTGSTLFFRRITVDVDQVYRGRVSDQIDLEGTDWGCSFFYVSSLAKGDRIFIASERLGPARFGETDLGNVLAWKRTNDRWAFYEDALQDGSNAEFYPTAARTARTTADILRLISRAAMPDASTAPVARTSAIELVLVLAAIFLTSLGAVLVASSRRAPVCVH